MSKIAIRWIIFCISVALSGGSVQGQDKGVSAIYSFQGIYVPDHWAPLRVEFRNRDSTPIRGYAQFGQPGSPLVIGEATAVYQVAADVPANARVRIATAAVFSAPIKGTAIMGDKGGTLARIVWRSDAGKEVDRTDLLAATCSSLILVVGVRSEIDNSPIYEPYVLKQILETSMEGAPQVVGVGAGELPRDFMGYGSAIAVAIEGDSPDELDLAQRQALLDYVRRGGVVIFSAPNPAWNIASSWIGQYLPVQPLPLVRQARGLVVSSSTLSIPAELEFRVWCDLSDAIELPGTKPGEVQIVLRDAHAVHAAYRNVGLGRIVYTSFPIGALDEKAKANAGLTIWQELLGRGRAPLDWRQTAMLTAREDRGQRVPGDQPQNRLMQQMIGIPAPAWWVAAVVAGGYLAIAIGVQLIVSQAQRPKAYILLTAIAAGSMFGVLGAGRLKNRQSELTGGRLVTVDLAATGGGRQQEAICFFGRNDDDFSLAAMPGQSRFLPTITVDRYDPAIIDLTPQRVPQAKAREGAPNRFWLVDAVVPTAKSLAAVVTFDAEGLELSVDNQSGSALREPVLMYGLHRISLGEIPPGRSTQTISPDAATDAAAGAGIISEQQRLRRAMLEELAQRTGPSGDRNERFVFHLAGWSDDAPPVMKTTPALQRKPRQEVLVRTNARVDVSPMGAKVVLADAFNQMIIPPTGMPFDPERKAWIQTNQSGEWSIGFAPPTEIGRINVRRALLTLDIHAGSQDVVLRSMSGTELGRWNGVVGRRTVELSPQPRDVDVNGWVWITLSITSTAAPGTMAPPWQVRDISLRYEGEVVGGVTPPVMHWRSSGGEAPADAPPPPAARNPKQPPAKQPAAKQKSPPPVKQPKRK